MVSVLSDREPEKRAGFRRVRELCRHSRHFYITKLYLDATLAVEYPGKAQENFGSTRRALTGAVSDAVAVLTQIGRRQRDVLHRGESHAFTPQIFILWEAGERSDTTPSDGKNSPALRY